MSPERPARTVGRCIVCGDMIVEVAVVEARGSGISLGAKLVRRCGCGDYEPSQSATHGQQNPCRTQDARLD